jgi:hypothetical protein
MRKRAFFRNRWLGFALVDLGPAGRPVTLGIRPEDIALGAPSEAGAFAFSVEMSEELGLGRLLHGRLAGADAIMLLPTGARFPAGNFAVRLPAAALHLFDHESGRRIELPAAECEPEAPVARRYAALNGSATRGQ